MNKESKIKNKTPNKHCPLAHDTLIASLTQFHKHKNPHIMELQIEAKQNSNEKSNLKKEC